MAEKSRTMERDRDEKSGRFTEQYSDEEFIEAIRAAGGAASTRDVVDHVGADYDATYKRLRALEDAGRDHQSENRKCSLVGNSRGMMFSVRRANENL